MSETIRVSFPHFKYQFDWDFIRLPNVGEWYLRVLAELQEVH